MKKTILLILTICLSISSVFAQATTGKIVGTVSAADGAVPGATIVVTDNQTNKERSVTATESGTFEVPQLEFGTYTVKITATGFKTFTVTDVKIDAGREYPLNAQLEVGQVSETVTVTGGAEQVNSTNGELSTTVSAQQIRELPLNGRNPLSLLNLQAGVNATSGSINGQRTSSVNYTRDGLNVQDNFIRNGFVSDQPTVDDTGEFNVVTQNAGVELGSGSTQVQLVTPRGGREFHGALYEFNRNSKFASNTFINNGNGVAKPFLNRNQFGGSISGPVPFFNFGEGGPAFSKNKAFFFFNYEGFRLANQLATSGTTLLPAARNGTYTYTDLTGTQRTVNVLTGAGLLTGTTAGAANFAASGGALSVSPTIQARVLNLLPTNANGAATGINYTQVLNFLVSNPEQRNNYVGRFDYDVNDRNSISAVYKHNNINDARTDTAFGFQTVPFTFQYGPTDFLALAYRMTPTNNFTNEIRGGFQYAKPYFGESGIPTNYLIVPQIVTSPEASFRQQGRNTDYYNIQDNASYTIGNHSIRFGGQLQTYNFLSTNYAGVTPTYSIATSGSAGPTRLATSLFPGGISTTDRNRADNLRYLLAGIVGSGQVTYNIGDSAAAGFQRGNPAVRTLKFKTYSAYVSDQWRFRPNVTVNAGMRYEYYTPLYDPRAVYIEPTVTNFDNPLSDLLNPNGTYRIVGGNAGKRGNFFKPDKNNFGPSVSIAYSPKFENGLFANLLGNSTVIRGGFKINYINDEYVRSADNAQLNNSFVTSTVVATTAAGSTSLKASLDPIIGFTGLPTIGIPTVNTPPFSYSANNTAAFSYFGTTSLIDPNIQVQKNYEYNLGIQREIGFKTVAEVRYVGGYSNQLVRSIDYNQLKIAGTPFLSDFVKAQQNCRLQGATIAANGDTRDPIFRCTSAAYNPAIAGSQPLTAFDSLLAGGGLLTNTTVLPYIQTGIPADLALLYIQNNLVNDRSAFLANVNTGVANLTTNGGSYFYNSLQSELRRRFSNGFSFQANYTFQKILTNISTSESDQTRVAAFLDNANPGKDYSRASYDRTHTFNFNAIFEVPFGKGKKYFNDGAVGKVLGGFQLSSIVTLSSGAPLTITDARGTLNRAGRSAFQTASSNLTEGDLKKLFGVFKTPNGVFFMNPNNLFALGSNGARIDLNQPLPAGVTIQSIRAASSIDQAPFSGQVFFFNPAGTTGNLTRYFINGPMYANWDAGLSRNIRFGETVRVQLRAEMFNVLNTTNFFAGGTADIGGTNFGRMNTSGNQYSNSGTNRQMQFAVRLDF